MQLPPVVRWVKVYEAALGAVYLALVVLGVVFLVADLPTKPDDPPPAFMGGLFICCGLPFAAVFAAAPFFPPSPRMWLVHLVLICIGLTSACCLPACIPLLIFWLKPEVKQAFGRQG